MLDDDKISGDAPFPEVHAPRTGVATAACPLLILWTAPPTGRASASESVAHVATRSRRRVGTHLGAASCFLPAELKNEHYAAPRVAAHVVLAAAAPSSRSSSSIRWQVRRSRFGRRALAASIASSAAT